MIIKDSYKFRDNFLAHQGDRKVDFLVFHHIEAKNIQEAIELLVHHKVSSHYIIDFNGDVFRLVDDNDVAFHAGYSFFKGVDGLNESSIGIELFSNNAYAKGFSDQQYQSLIDLSRTLISKNNIAIDNVVGHSDIAYYPENCELKFQDQVGLLDRKDDPSHLFNWRLMAENKVALSPVCYEPDYEIYNYSDIDDEIITIKKLLSNFGYKVGNYSSQFDIEMRNLSRVFNRRFNQNAYKVKPDAWWFNNSKILKQLVI